MDNIRKAKYSLAAAVAISMGTAGWLGAGAPKLTLSVCPEFPPENVLSAVVKVSNDHGSATAFHVGDGVFYTAAHSSAKGALKHGDTELTTVFSVSSADYARLRAPEGRYAGTPRLRVHSGDLRRGTRVWAVGYPVGGGLVVTEGRAQHREGDFLGATASVAGGMSGGPLLACSRGHWGVVGVISRYVAPPMPVFHPVFGPAPLVYKVHYSFLGLSTSYKALRAWENLSL